jgi:hypothetical protein
VEGVGVVRASSQPIRQASVRLVGLREVVTSDSHAGASGERGHVRLDDALRLLLMAAGIALIALSLQTWLGDSPPPRTTVTKTTAPADDATATPSPSTIVEEKQTSRGRITRTITRTIAAPTSESTTTVGPTPSNRSEAVTLAWLGIGLLLVLAGAFQGRLQSIGAAGVTLTFKAAAETVDKLAARMATSEKILKSQETDLGRVKSSLEDLLHRVAALEAKQRGEEFSPQALDAIVEEDRLLQDMYAEMREREQVFDELAPLRAESEQALRVLRDRLQGLEGR